MAQGNSGKLNIKVKNLPLDVELNTSASVIYLVGKNGAGKSRFIDGLKDSKGSIILNSNSPRNASIPFRYIEWGAAQNEYNFLNSVGQGFKDLNATLSLTGQEPVSFVERTEKGKVEIIDGQRKRKDEVLEQPVRNNIDFVGLEHFSEGTEKLHQLLDWKINDGLKSPFYPTKYEKQRGQAQLLVVGIEEPENSLHPKLQKQLPELLHTWILNQKVNYTILIVVSTHSPFVIKGVSEFRDTQRVYGLDECKMIDLTGRNEEHSALVGVSGSQSIIAANKMLGSGIGDFFPNPILMAESSVSELLTKISENLDISFDEFIVNPQGDGDIEGRIGNLQKMAKVFRKMHKSFPERDLFNFKIIIVVDDVSKAEEFEAKFNNVEEFKIESYGIGKDQLEDAYPQTYIDEFIYSKFPEKISWDKSNLINDYLENELNLKGQKKGIFKKDLATFVSSKIKNGAELEKNLKSVSELLSKIGIK